MSTRAKSECAEVGLGLKAKKTEYSLLQHNFSSADHLALMTRRGFALKEASDFKYLGSRVNLQEQQLKAKKAPTLKALLGISS